MLILSIVACGDKTSERERDDGRSAVEAELISTHFESYSYKRERVELASTEGQIQAALAYEGRIYYAYIDSNPQGTSVLVLTSINIDGSDVRHVEMQSPGNMVASFNITDDGNYVFFILYGAITQQGITYNAYYVEYDHDGEEITRQEFADFSLIENPQSSTFTILRDGRVLVFNMHENVIYEIDFDNQDWGKAYYIAEDSRSVPGLFSASASSPYDFLISDDSYLYGYIIEANEQVVLLDWTESGFADLFLAQVGLYSNNRIFIITTESNASGEPVAELYVLSPVGRNEMPDVITLTIGGIFVSEEARRAAAQFNRQNSQYRIVVKEYYNAADIPTSGNITPDIMKTVRERAIYRFQVDIMAGNIPDIFVDPYEELFDRGLLLDLNPFFDADPEIHRADFFPNVIAAMKQSDGTLRAISHRFGIKTIMSRYGILGHIESWTPAEMLALIQSSQGVSIPLGTGLLRDEFLRNMIYVFNMGFIDRDNFIADFNSEEFINLLNIAKLLPTIDDISPDIWIGDIVSEIMRIDAGEQLLMIDFISRPMDYQYFADTFDDSIALGIPSVSGGVHIVEFFASYGVSANTDHADAAWSFLRSFLLPSASNFGTGYSRSYGFPVRFDLFDLFIEEAMVPNPYTWENDQGETVEAPREFLHSNSDTSSTVLIMYELSEEKAKSLRAIIDSAVPARQGVSSELWEVIKGDLADFYAGARSAEDTANIIQNRAERWLSELELVSGG